MTYDTIFALINTAVLPAWALLLLAPRWRWTQAIAHSVTVPLLAGVYVVLIAFALATDSGAQGADFTTLEGVAAISSHPLGVVAGWAHYLAFDLFVGGWVGRDARRARLPHWQVVPCLVLCFVAGPAGLFAYLVLRRVRRPGYRPVAA